ncbi:phosphoribosyltransferase [Reyranella sp. CPCC 100927]|uniref:phosphoribosyltransferase family protein n=1 Tax=Reyranella sp. CPCC 100927 TaxID=2599616 RepID=UPI0011B7286C|nr:phosphoribosyltransferase [Reyranella sp. CPCC 100927]TWT01712.1 phosphoribosyltransferase [Reyranella sp. CPCC 100927]
MPPDTIEHNVLQAARRGHFRYESGHHGDLWLDLDALLADARRTRQWATALATRAAACRPDAVCGPLTGGAFVAQFIAAEIGIEFAFAERQIDASGTARYSIPAARRAALSGRRVLLVDDAVNAGSALLATAADLVACGADVAGFASLIALGDAAPRLSAQRGVPFFTLASLERQMWLSQDCPLCRAQVPLEHG